LEKKTGTSGKTAKCGKKERSIGIKERSMGSKERRVGKKESHAGKTGEREEKREAHGRRRCMGKKDLSLE
jgi:hypothetical protein